MRLYKYRCFRMAIDKDRFRDIIEGQRVYCPTPDKLNDPYDCNIGSADHLMGCLVKLGVFSVSGPGHDDILLFSYYAGDHTGVCLEFEAETHRTIGETSFLGFAEPVEYVRNFPLFSRDTIHRLPWTKYQAWRHEMEYRVPADLKLDPSPFRRFEKGELVGIRFGLRMNNDDQELIRRWVEAVQYPNLVLYRTVLRNDSFALEYQRV